MQRGPLSQIPLKACPPPVLEGRFKVPTPRGEPPALFGPSIANHPSGSAGGFQQSEPLKAAMRGPYRGPTYGVTSWEVPT